jgi:hypothetical protein
LASASHFVAGASQLLATASRLLAGTNYLLASPSRFVAGAEIKSEQPKLAFSPKFYTFNPL